MTKSLPTPSADDHPEVAEISAFDEGVLPPERSPEISAHLSSCELCADVLDSLREIRGALGTLPGPVRMPEDIAGRIDAALAAEAALGSSLPTAAFSHDAEDVPAPEGAEPAQEPGSAAGASPAEDADAASAGASEASSSVGVSRETPRPAKVRESRGASRRPPSRPRGRTGPGRDGARSPRRRRTLLLTAAAACAALLAGGIMIPLVLGDDDRQSSAGSAEASDNLTAADLDAEVRKLLESASKDSAEEAPSAAEEPPGGLPSEREERDGSGRDDSGARPEESPTTPFGVESAPAVPGCVLEGIGRSEAPLAARQQTYEGKDSFLVVLPHLRDQQQVDAYVVDAGCTDGATGEPGEILNQETVARP